MLICPVCSMPLQKQNNAYVCEKHHSFDCAKSGYVNLLTGSKPGEFTGDSKEMVAARRRFLDSGCFAPLRDALTEELCKSETPVNVVDVGCGEGYYTRDVAQKLPAGSEIVGIDISKAATDYAAKRDKITQYVTASVFRMPVASGSADLAASVFAPTPAEEIRRILKPDGTCFLAVPGARHLLELKQAVYDEAYLNREEKHTLEGFVLTDTRRVEYVRRISSNELLSDLFTMTPYYHRTPKEGFARLAALSELDVTMSFLILKFKQASVG